MPDVHYHEDSLRGSGDSAASAPCPGSGDVAWADALVRAVRTGRAAVDGGDGAPLAACPAGVAGPRGHPGERRRRPARSDAARTAQTERTRLSLPARPPPPTHPRHAGTEWGTPVPPLPAHRTRRLPWGRRRTKDGGGSTCTRRSSRYGSRSARPVPARPSATSGRTPPSPAAAAGPPATATAPCRRRASAPTREARGERSAAAPRSPGVADRSGCVPGWLNGAEGRQGGEPARGVLEIATWPQGPADTGAQQYGH